MAKEIPLIGVQKSVPSRLKTLVNEFQSHYGCRVLCIVAEQKPKADESGNEITASLFNYLPDELLPAALQLLIQHIDAIGKEKTETKEDTTNE